jgi:hypothetical protein
MKLSRTKITQAHKAALTWLIKHRGGGKLAGRRDEYYTNVGLMACIEDGIPIGVMRQTSQKPMFNTK